jgi:RNA polymerase sigma-70 factor (ECF subfamily)
VVSPSAEGVERLTPSQAAAQRYADVVVPEIPLLLRAATAMTGNRAIAADLAQEALLRAFRGWDRFDRRYPRAWLLAILREAAASQGRTSHSEIPADSRAWDRTKPAAEHVPVDAELRPDIDDALRALPAHQHQAVVLVEVHGFTTAEAAAILGVRPGTMTSRLHRARRRMRTAVALPEERQPMLETLRRSLQVRGRRQQCRESARLLQLHLDGVLDPTRSDFLHHHLDVCRRCGLQAQAYQRIQQSLREGRQAPDPDAVRRLRRLAQEIDAAD